MAIATQGALHAHSREEHTSERERLLKPRVSLGTIWRLQGKQHRLMFGVTLEPFKFNLLIKFNPLTLVKLICNLGLWRPWPLCTP